MERNQINEYLGSVSQVGFNTGELERNQINEYLGSVSQVGFNKVR